MFFYFSYTLFLFIFVPEMLVLRIPNLASERVMKRESGENPEQTRCCKASLNPSQGGEQDAAKITNATVP